MPFQISSAAPLHFRFFYDKEAQQDMAQSMIVDGYQVVPVDTTASDRLVVTAKDLYKGKTITIVALAVYRDSSTKRIVLDTTHSSPKLCKYVAARLGSLPSKYTGVSPRIPGLLANWFVTLHRPEWLGQGCFLPRVGPLLFNCETRNTCNPNKLPHGYVATKHEYEILDVRSALLRDLE